MASPQIVASLVCGNRMPLHNPGMCGALLSGNVLKAGVAVSWHISADKSPSRKQVKFPLFFLGVICLNACRQKE